MDIQIVYDNEQQMFDWGNDFAQTKDIETLIQAQLFTDKNSWWGDDDLGSDLYQVYKNKNMAYDYCVNALKFLTDYNLCKNYTVTTNYNDGLLNIKIGVEYTTGINKEYEYVWSDV